MRAMLTVRLIISLSLFLTSLPKTRTLFFFFLIIRPPPKFTLFPSPPLFRSPKVAAPGTDKIPIRPADIVHVGVNHQPNLAGSEAARFTGGAVVESDSPAEALHGRQASHLRLFGYTGFFVQRVAVSKRQEDRIAILVGGLFRVPASLNAFRGKERRLPHL